jgi:hypothetical protein
MTQMVKMKLMYVQAKIEAIVMWQPKDEEM